MKKFFYLTLAGAAWMSLTACQESAQPSGDTPQGPAYTDAIAIVEDIPTTQAFTAEAVPAEDIQKIVNAGMNCPSAMNGQPWHFTVITQAQTIAQLGQDMKSAMPPRPAPKPDAPKADAKPDGPKPDASKPDGPKPDAKPRPHSGVGDSPLLILISCKEGSELDAGLAVQNMNAMACLLGYGTKIASSIQVITRGEKKAEYEKQFGVPEGMYITTSLLVGKVDHEAYDAVSSATPRQPQEETVTYIE